MSNLNLPQIGTEYTLYQFLISFFNRKRKKINYIEKYILELIIIHFLDKGNVINKNLIIDLPLSKKRITVNLTSPINLDPNVRSKIQRKIKNISEKVTNHTAITDWDRFIRRNLSYLTLSELLFLKKNNKFKHSTWSFIEKNLSFLYKDNDIKMKNSQFFFKVEQLLEKYYLGKELKNVQSDQIKSYKESLRLFTNKEKEVFRKKIREIHYTQSISKVEGIQIESIMYTSILEAHPDKAVIWVQGSHQPGYDVVTICPDREFIPISSKTGKLQNGIIYLSSNRSQGQITLQDKVKHIDEHWKSASMITALLCVLENGKIKYIRVALDPKKIKFGSNFNNWKTENPSKKDNKKGWKKYTFDNCVFKSTISESKSHQFDYFIPIELTDIIDEFYVDIN